VHDHVDTFLVGVHIDALPSACRGEAPGSDRVDVVSRAFEPVAQVVQPSEIRRIDPDADDQRRSSPSDGGGMSALITWNGHAPPARWRATVVRDSAYLMPVRPSVPRLDVVDFFEGFAQTAGDDFVPA
jgi:hypothetical protein